MKIVPSIRRSLTVLCISVATLTGCQSYYYVPSPKFDVESPLGILSQAAQDAVAEQQTYALDKKAFNEDLALRQRSFRTDVIRVDYVGEPQTLLQSAAYHFGYRFIEAGNIHQLPIVNFSKRKLTGFDLIKDVDLQLGNSATVDVDENDKTITLIHR
ncbi:DotD/TraH family lipoprotein [Acinetobacter baumannii]